MSTQEEVTSTIIKDLTDEGKLLEAGFNVLRELIIPSNASEGQISDMQFAYMALPCNSITLSSGTPARWCRASIFWVMMWLMMPRLTSSANAMWPALGLADPN